MRHRWLAFYGRVDQHGLLGTGGAMLAARGVSVLTGIGLAVLLARTLGAEGYGVYVFALTLAFMLSMPVQMGLPTLLMRQVSIYRSQHDWAHLGGMVRWSAGLAVLSLTTVSLAAGGYLLLRDGTEAGAAGATQLYAFTLLLVGVLCFIQLSAAVLHGSIATVVTMCCSQSRLAYLLRTKVGFDSTAMGLPVRYRAGARHQNRILQDQEVS